MQRQESGKRDKLPKVRIRQIKEKIKGASRMKVREYIDDKISKESAVHLSLIDPDEQSPERAGEMASAAEDGGTDGIMVGGSTSAAGKLLNHTVKEVKKQTDLPTILFPGSEGGVSKGADAIFFMSLLNSSDPHYLIGAQKKGAPFVKKFGIEPISMAYLIVEPGGTVGKVGKADLIERDDVESAVAYSLASQYFGMSTVYLEAGSGAENPVPPRMVKSVRESVDSRLVVGGGIRSPELAAERVEAGADIIVTGTLLERSGTDSENIEPLIDAIKC